MLAQRDGIPAPEHRQHEPEEHDRVQGVHGQAGRMIAPRVKPAGKVLGAQEQGTERLVDANPRRGEGGDDLLPAQSAEVVVVADVDVVVEIDEPILEHRREREPRQRRKGQGYRHGHPLGNRDGHQVLLEFHPQFPHAAAFAGDRLRAPRHGGSSSPGGRGSGPSRRIPW